MTDEEPHGLFRRKVVEAGGFWQMAWLFFTQGFQMASQSLIRMGISQSFDRAPELLNYEGFPLVALRNLSGIEQKTLIIAC